MSGTGIETPLRTGFVVGVMVLLEAPAVARGEWALWEGLAKLLCLPERPQEANPRAAGTSSGFGMLLEQVEPHPAAAWGPCGAVAAGQQRFGPHVFLGCTSPLRLGSRHRLEQAGAASSSPALCHWKHEKSDVKIKGTYSLLSHLFACCSLPLIYLQKCLWLLLALERMLGDKGHFFTCYHIVTELRAVDLFRCIEEDNYSCSMSSRSPVTWAAVGV